ncbi:MAG: flagellar basal body P-ring formation chaperone FlgA [Gammaproteobacteria bacterium]|nr:flagellar basal body P-ring formation chaperone FlgA [Gammaproteobacteria bacterium]
MNLRSIIMTLTLLNSCLIGGITMASTNKTFQSHESILSAVRTFLESQNELQQYKKVNIQLGRIDPRLKLTRCEQSLQLSLAPGSDTTGKTTVNIRCPSDSPWGLYVTATINKFATVYQTAAHLNKGHIITEGDVQAVEYNLAKLNQGYFTDKKSLIGKETRRQLIKGKVIQPNQVKETLLVKQGEQVALVAKSSRFAVRMPGKALMNGALGDHIRVKNMSSKRIIEGKVTRAGEVTVLN